MPTLIVQSIEVRLVSLIDLDLMQVRPQPAGLEDAERIMRVFRRSPRLLTASSQALELLTRTGPYAIDSVTQLLTDALRGLR